MALFIAISAGDRGEVLLASILSSISARLFLFTSNGIGPCSLRVVFYIGFFLFLLLFLPLLSRFFLILSEVSDWSDLGGSVLAGKAVIFNFLA